MLNLLALFATFSLLQDSEEGLLLEERLIATIPEGMSLERPGQPPRGQSHQSPNRVRWSADGRRAAYIGILDGEEHPVLDDEVLDAYDFVAGPSFSEFGSRAVFLVGNQKNKKSQKWWVLLDGKEIYEEDWIGPIALAPNGEAVAFWAQPGAKIQSDGAFNNNGQHLVLLEEKGRRWKESQGERLDNALSSEPPTFTGDSQRAFSVGGNLDGGWDGAGVTVFALERGEKRASEVGELTRLPSNLAVDRAGKHWGATLEVWTAVDGKLALTDEFVVLDGERVEHDGSALHGPFFSPLDKRVAYWVRKEGRYGISVDGKQITPDYDFVFEPVFGAKNQLAFVAASGLEPSPLLPMQQRARTLSGGQRFVVSVPKRGEVQRHEFDWLEVRDLVFSEDGEHLAYAARSEAGWQVILDEVAGPVFDEVDTPRFSEDGDLLLHGARRGPELWWKVWSPAGAPEQSK